MDRSRRALLVGGAGLLAAGCAPSSPRRTADLLRAAPRIGMGTYTLGDDPARRAEEIAALRLGLELGIGHVDTAEMYGDGRAEALVGEALAGRRGAFITTKLHPDRASHDGTLAAARASARRLRVAAIDLYLLHMPPTRHPLDETLRAFARLVAEGTVRLVGVSNFEAPAQLAEAQRALGAVPLACDQVKHTLRDRHAERALGGWCAPRGVALVGYTPFDGFPEDPADPARAALDEIAARHEATARQVALAFLVHRGVRAIPRASRLEHVRENAGALALRLDAAELGRLEAALPG